MNKIDEAVRILNQGGIIIFPTDTAFGIGCRIDKLKSIEKLFKIRRRPKSQPVPVLVDSSRMAEKYWHSPIPHIVRQLIKKYWPGGLTIIYNAILNRVPLQVTGYSRYLGLRMPDHKIALSLIKGAKIPILGPSANFHREKTPYEFNDLNPDLVKLVDFVLPGTCKTKKASTVIDCSKIPYKIIREGAVKLTV